MEESGEEAAVKLGCLYGTTIIRDISYVCHTGAGRRDVCGGNNLIREIMSAVQAAFDRRAADVAHICLVNVRVIQS